MNFTKMIKICHFFTKNVHFSTKIVFFPTTSSFRSKAGKTQIAKFWKKTLFFLKKDILKINSTHFLNRITSKKQEYRKPRIRFEPFRAQLDRVFTETAELWHLSFLIIGPLGLKDLYRATEKFSLLNSCGNRFSIRKNPCGKIFRKCLLILRC